MSKRIPKRSNMTSSTIARQKEIERSAEWTTEYKRLMRNGITLDDVTKAIKDGYDNGWRDGNDNSMRVCYAAAAYVLHQHNIDHETIAEFVQAMDAFVATSYTGPDSLDWVFDQTGIQIIMDNDGVIDSKVQPIQK